MAKDQERNEKDIDDSHFLSISLAHTLSITLILTSSLSLSHTHTYTLHYIRSLSHTHKKTHKHTNTLSICSFSLHLFLSILSFFLSLAHFLSLSVHMDQQSIMIMAPFFTLNVFFSFWNTLIYFLLFHLKETLLRAVKMKGGRITRFRCFQPKISINKNVNRPTD